MTTHPHTTHPDTHPKTPPNTPSDTQPVGLYADATTYDILHTPGTAAELDALERIAARTVRTHRTNASSPAQPQRWLEPACGSGRCVRLAAKRGTPCVGFDLDHRMVAYADERLGRTDAPKGSGVMVADMRTCVDDGDIPESSFDFAFNTINSFRHLMSDADALAHLTQVARALRPGGVYAVGLSTAAYGIEFPTEDVWHAARGSVSITQTVQYLPPTGEAGGARTERVISHLAIDRPTGTEHRDSTYALRTYSLDQWLDLIERSPLELIETADDAGRPTEPGEPGYRVYTLGRAHGPELRP